MLEAHVVGHVRGKFDQVVFELCYEEDSVLRMNGVGRRLTGRDTEALNLDDSRASRANAGACQRWSCPQVRRPLSLIGACTHLLCLQIRTLTLSVSGATLMMNSIMKHSKSVAWFNTSLRHELRYQV